MPIWFFPICQCLLDLDPKGGGVSRLNEENEVFLSQCAGQSFPDFGLIHILLLCHSLMQRHVLYKGICRYGSFD